MLPQLRIETVRAVYNDGNHNAFTDLCRFGNRLYLTFRSCPEGHGVSPAARILVMVSEDGLGWEPVFSFFVPNRDTRDPHFLVFGQRLFVYTGTWWCPVGQSGPYRMNEHLGYCAWSDDGRTWHGPRHLEGTYGHYIWRAATHGGKAYLCGRRWREFIPPTKSEEAERTESALLESEDGFVWRFVGLFQETHGDETAFLFEEDGSIVAVSRCKGNLPAQLVCARPPYREWTRTSLDRHIGGPLLARWGAHYLVGGRLHTNEAPPYNAVTALYWLVEGRLHEAARLPSGGDNSYPGFVPLSNTRALLSYYSSHEGSCTGLPPSAIYVAELTLGTG